MAYRFPECNNKRFVPWKDLRIEITNNTIRIYDEKDPNVSVEHKLNLFVGDIRDWDAGTQTDPQTNTPKQVTCGDRGIAPTWSVPKDKKFININNLNSIWIPYGVDSNN